MEQIALLGVLRRHAGMVIVLSVVATLAAYAFSFLLSEQYEASALVLVRPQQTIKIGANKSNKEFMDFPISKSTSVETPSKTFIEIIKSDELIGKVVRTLGLDKEGKKKESSLAKFLPPFFITVIDNIKQGITHAVQIVKYGRFITEDPFDKAVKGVEGGLSLKATDDTYLFAIKYRSEDPHQAAAVTNMAANAFIGFMNQIRQSETRQIRQDLQVQLDKSRGQLETARQRLEDYKKAHSVFLYETEYNTKLKVIADLEVEVAKADASLAGSQNTLSKASLTARRAMLIRLLDERKAELAPLPELERQLKQLDEDVKAAATTYDIVDKALKEADIKYSYATPEVRLVSQAVPPRLPISPKRGTITGVALLGGLMVGVGLALLLEYLKRGVRSIQDIEDFVGIKVIATIPRVSKRRWHLAGLS